LIAALGDNDEWVRYTAVDALGKLGATTPDVTAGLLAALCDNNWGMRCATVQALGWLGAASSDVTAGLLAALRDDNQQVRRYAAQALGELGAVTPDVVHALLVAAGDKNWDVTTDAWSALKKLGKVEEMEELASPTIVRGLLAAVMHGLRPALFEGYGLEAAQALVRLGQVTPEVTLFWLTRFHTYHYNEYSLNQAAAMLDRIAEQSPTIFLAGLKKALTANNAKTRQMAMRIIGYYATDQETLQALQRLSKSPSAWFRTELRAGADDAAARYARKLTLFGVSSPPD
jgi:HEAT repeat protein